MCEGLLGHIGENIIDKTRGHPFDTAIIQVYAPTSNSSDEEIETFYEDLDKVMKLCKSQEIVFVMGDLNAKVGKGKEADVVGPHGLGNRNERGDMWVQWCIANGQVITNTFFKQHPRRLYTWQSPDGNTRNQIDFITINKRFRNAVRIVKGYPGADCNTDHIALIAEVNVKLKKTTRAKKQRKYDLSKLKSVETKTKYTEAVKQNISEIKENDSTEAMYTKLQGALTSAADAVLPKESRKTKNEWMTDEILNMMDKRRQSRRGSDEYKRINTEIRKKCRQQKELHYQKLCSEIEHLEKVKPQLMHEKVREVTNTKRNIAQSCIEAKDGTKLIEDEQILLRWNEYIKDLFSDEERKKPTITKKSGNQILEDEVQKALASMQNGKAAGPDGIVTEMLTAIEELGTKWVTILANKIYDDGRFPEMMCKSVFVAMPKKPGATKCENFRTISLMSHLTKVVLRVLLNRLRGRTAGEVAEEQYGFMPDKGTRNAIFVLKILSERAIEMQKDLYVCFIDYVKAFDKVKHEPLIEMMNELDLDGKDVELIMNLYWDQQAAVRWNDKMSEYVDIRSGVRQGCVMSPDLFSLYSELIMRNISDFEGIKVGGVNLNNLRYADDTTLLADSQQKLQDMLNRVVAESELKGLEINKKKSFTMVFSKKEINPGCNITVNGEMLIQVQSFSYLGSMVSADGRSDTEIKRRIGIAKTTYKKLEKVLNSKCITLDTRMRLLKCYVWSTLLYGCESWTISQVMERRIMAAEMWFLRRMFKIRWTDKITNNEVLRRARTGRELIRTIIGRQIGFLGHAMRKDKIEALVLTGKIEGNRGRGRPRLSFMTWLERATDIKPVQLMRMVKMRQEKEVMTVANARTLARHTD